MHKQTHYEGNLKTRLENEDLFGNDFIASFMLLITLFKMLPIIEGCRIMLLYMHFNSYFPDYPLSNNNDHIGNRT